MIKSVGFIIAADGEFNHLLMLYVNRFQAQSALAQLVALSPRKLPLIFT